MDADVIEAVKNSLSPRSIFKHEQLKKEDMPLRNYCFPSSMWNRYYVPVQTILLSFCILFIFYADMTTRDLALSLPPRQTDPWWTYLTSITVHHNAWHLWQNMLILLIPGTIFETMHGGFTLQGVFWVSGITGTLAEATCSDTRSRIYMGMSPAVLGIIGAYLGHLALNWNETRFRLTVAAALTIYTGTSIAVYTNKPQYNIAHLSHVAGFTQGVYVGILAVHNECLERGERVLRVIAFFLSSAGIILTVFRVGDNAIRDV